MSTEIYIISGFLGAGKTTLIQKLLNEAFKNEKVALIENDFGEISVDAALLKEGSVNVTEINSGCICCSLAGDFVKALQELLDRFQPDKIIIEPSGVGKLSDIMKACSDPGLQSRINVKTKITVADVKRCKMYLDNFGEFFEDQIENADVILLSRTEDFPAKITDAYQLIKSLNNRAAILAKPWAQISADEILSPQDDHHEHSEHGRHGHECGCEGGCGCSCGQHEHGGQHHHSGCDGHKHEHAQAAHQHTEHGAHEHSHTPHENCAHDHSHHGDCGHDHSHHGDCGHNHADHESCGHNHSAEEAFDTVTILTKRVFSIGDLKARVAHMEKNAKGIILRAKGILRSPGGYVNLQYLPGDIRITKCAASGNMLCIIGQNLDRQELANLFGGAS